MTDAPIRILVVEDDPRDLRLTREYLADPRSHPFEVCQAGNVAAAQTQLASARFDAVVLDLGLPDSNGMETPANIRAVAGELPIIILTGLDNDDIGVEAVRLGAQDYLVKGDISRGVLARAVQNAITRKTLQQALADRTRELETANKLKELFTDIMRHDLLEQVNVMLGAADLLLAHETDSESQDMLKTIVRRAERLTEVIRAASLYAKLERPEALEKERLDLNALIQAAVAEVRPLVAEKQQRLTVRSEPQSYSLVNPIIQNAVVNLLSNAVRYSPPGRRIEVKLAAAGDHYRLAVKDWGNGISLADRGRLFTRFQRLEKGSIKGTGLGLAIVKRIVDLHGGQVSVGENPEGGSVFTIDIPKG